MAETRTSSPATAAVTTRAEDFTDRPGARVREPSAGQRARRRVELGALKIMVVGTPKAGNTWLRHLLSALYDLPQVDLQPDFGQNDWTALGPRWVGQEHYHPTADMMACAQELGVVFVSPIRHPGDVLVSLRHHVENRGDEPSEGEPPAMMLRDGPGVYGEHTRRFLEQSFYFNLHLSIYWVRGGWSHPVRYEDLWLRPVETLRQLTSRILPVSERRLHHAIAACAAGQMQRKFDPKKQFVRAGGLGQWTEVLPAAIREVLAKQEPYPEQLAALGYSMRLDAPANARHREPAGAVSPLAAKCFANGVPMAPLLVQLYLDAPETLSSQWSGAADSTGPGSFYDWLNRPAAADPDLGRARPVITELAHYLHRLRADLRQVFPDPFGAQRMAFGDWFLFSARREYRFDDRFALPVIRSWAEGAPL